MSDSARGGPCNYKYKRSSRNSILGSLMNGQLQRQKFRTSSSSRKGKDHLGFLKLQMITAVHGGLPYGLSFPFFKILFNKTHARVTAEQQQKVGLDVPEASRSGGCGPLWLSLPGCPGHAGRRQTSMMSEGQSPLSARFFWSVGQPTDPGPDLAPWLLAFWRPATWSLFR